MKRSGAPEEAASAADDLDQGVHTIRPALPPRAALIDPRDTAWDELVAAYKRHLLARAARGAAPVPATPEERAFSLPGLSEQLSTVAYRYTKGADFTNDNLGYGEALHEQLWWVSDDGRVTSQRRTSQLTKTGKQFLNAEPERPTEARASAMSARPPVSASSRGSQAARKLPEQASAPRKRAP